MPELIRGAEQVFEYPMVDRDPVSHWTEGRVTLMGDAAHPTYPVGSNGASQAIVDARVIGGQMRQHGATAQALRGFEALVRPRAEKFIMGQSRVWAGCRDAAGSKTSVAGASKRLKTSSRARALLITPRGTKSWPALTRKRSTQNPRWLARVQTWRERI